MVVGRLLSGDLLLLERQRLVVLVAHLELGVAAREVVFVAGGVDDAAVSQAAHRFDRLRNSSRLVGLVVHELWKDEGGVRRSFLCAGLEWR